MGAQSKNPKGRNYDPEAGEYDGAVREVHAWNTGGGAGERPVPTEEHVMPDFLKWDLWLGPARFRPFHAKWMAWHGWRDFGTANLGKIELKMD